MVADRGEVGAARTVLVEVLQELSNGQAFSPDRAEGHGKQHIHSFIV